MLFIFARCAISSSTAAPILFPRASPEVVDKMLGSRIKGGCTELEEDSACKTWSMGLSDMIVLLGRALLLNPGALLGSKKASEEEAFWFWMGCSSEEVGCY